MAAGKTHAEDHQIMRPRWHVDTAS